MSDELEQVQANIVAAVQQELSRFSREVDTVVKQIRSDLAKGETARGELEDQVRSLAAAIETSQGANTKFKADLQHALEERLNEYSDKTKRRHDEMNDRLGRVVDEANVGIAAAVESVARPIMKTLEQRQDKTETDVGRLDGSLRRFDEQAAKMVSHINGVTTAIEGRLEQVTQDVLASFDDRHAALVQRLDEVSAMAARQQTEVNNLVGQRVDSAEDRINERIVGLEGRMNEEIGQRVADIDAHVGRVSAGLDDAVITLSDRIAKADQKFTQVESEFESIREDLQNVDAEAIDEMKDKISSALGQAELVRIEVERFQATVTENLDKTSVRITELETTVQDQFMDVEQAVQLERLEEVERAVLMLDPDQFVRKDELDGHRNGAAPSVSDDPSGSAPRPGGFESPSSAGLAPPASAFDPSDAGSSPAFESAMSDALQPPVSS